MSDITRRNFIKYAFMGIGISIISHPIINTMGCASDKVKKTIYICMGKHCKKKGSENILKAFEEQLGIKSGETTSDVRFTLETTKCLEECKKSPVVKVGDKIFGNVKLEDVANIIKDLN